MESRRLVVWISAGILGFQGATLAFDLLNCTVLTWLFVRQHGMGGVAPGGRQQAGEIGPAEGPEAQERAASRPQPGPGVGAAPRGAEPGRFEPTGESSQEVSTAQQQGTATAPSQRPRPESARPQQAPQGPPVVGAFDPSGVFCAQPRTRIDDAVSQGLTILAGLALGSSVGGRGSPNNGEP
jgi:hypothetical protein